MVDQLLTIKDVAEYLGVSDRTIRRWIKGRRLKAINLNHGAINGDGTRIVNANYRIRKVDLQNFLDKCAKAPVG